MKILVINPGGTSTKIAVFEDEEELFKENITHTGEDLKGFPHVFDQFGYRKDIILETLKKAGFEIRTFAAVAGRGGLMNPIPGGTYTVNSRMVEDLRGAIHGEHPSNLGAVLAKEIGDEIDEFDAEDDGPEPGDVVASADLPGGSPEAAWDEFMTEHAKVWMPQFAEACEKDSRVPFYKQAASLLGAFIK